MWSLDNGGVCLAGHDASLELAVAGVDGAIMLWDTQSWTETASFQINGAGSIASMKYCTSKSSKLPKTILLVFRVLSRKIC